jgi:hypothetical protein
MRLKRDTDLPLHSVLSYTDCIVVGGPSDFPDGNYTVTFHEYRLFGTRHKGRWLSCGPATRIVEPERTVAP